MRKLIFIGGNRGIEKTTLSKRISEEINKRFIQMVKDLHYKEVVVDGYYSYYDTLPFSDEEFIKLLADSKCLLILLTAPQNLILERVKKKKGIEDWIKKK